MSRFVFFFLVCLVFAFLYLPLAVVVVYSFNESRLVTVWSGFSLHWYGVLFEDGKYLNAAIMSLKVGVLAASLATALGCLAGYALARLPAFRGRTLLGGLGSVPLVMPDAVTGLSLLLLFIAMQGFLGWPGERGFLTVVLAHATYGMAFVTVTVQARLAGSDPSVEEAAMDLGARPATVFFTVTLPMMAPALVAGWLLAFTLSLDDVVLASFVNGPGATTLPIEVLSSVRRGVSPQVNALTTLMLAAVSLALILAGYATAKRKR